MDRASYTKHRGELSPVALHGSGQCLPAPQPFISKPELKEELLSAKCPAGAGRTAGQPEGW